MTGSCGRSGRVGHDAIALTRHTRTVMRGLTPDMSGHRRNETASAACGDSPAAILLRGTASSLAKLTAMPIHVRRAGKSAALQTGFKARLKIAPRPPVLVLVGRRLKWLGLLCLLALLLLRAARAGNKRNCHRDHDHCQSICHRRSPLKFSSVMLTTSCVNASGRPAIVRPGENSPPRQPRMAPPDTSSNDRDNQKTNARR